MPPIENLIVLYNYREPAPRRTAGQRNHELRRPFQRFLFPVNPETITVSMGRDAIEVPLLKLGTILRPGNTRPIDVSFDSFFPRKGTAASWINPSDGQPVGTGGVAVAQDPAWSSVRLLRGWQNEEQHTRGKLRGMTPLRVTVSDTDGFVDFWCMISEFNVSTRPREVGDVYYSLTLRQVRKLPEMRRSRRQKGGKRRGSRRVSGRPPKPKTKTRANETLHQVCKRVYGTVDARAFRALYRANKKTVGANYLRRLPAGLTLRTPTVDLASDDQPNK